MPFFYHLEWFVQSESARKMQKGHMTPIWAFQTVLPPGSIAPIAKFAPPGPCIRSARSARCVCNNPSKAQRQSSAKTAGQLTVQLHSIPVSAVCPRKRSQLLRPVQPCDCPGVGDEALSSSQRTRVATGHVELRTSLLLPRAWQMITFSRPAKRQAHTIPLRAARAVDGTR